MRRQDFRSSRSRSSASACVCLAHAGQQFLERISTYLTRRHLLAVAEGQTPAAVKAIIDIDLAELPSLDPTHRDYTRREETRTRRELDHLARLDLAEARDAADAFARRAGRWRLCLGKAVERDGRRPQVVDAVLRTAASERQRD